MKTITLAGCAAALLLGFALPVAADWLIVGFDNAVRWEVLLVAGITVATSRWILPTLGAVRLGLIALVAASILGWLW